MLSPITKLIKNEERLFDLARSVNPRKKRILNCVYCNTPYEEGDEEFPQVDRYGWCIRCEDIQRDYENDMRVKPDKGGENE